MKMGLVGGRVRRPLSWVLVDSLGRRNGIAGLVLAAWGRCGGPPGGDQSVKVGPLSAIHAGRHGIGQSKRCDVPLERRVHRGSFKSGARPVS